MSARVKKKKKSARAGGSKLRGKAKARQRATRGQAGGAPLAWPTPPAGVGGEGAAVAVAPEVAEVADGAGGGSAQKVVAVGKGGADGGTEKFSRKREARQAELAARQTRDGLRWIGVGLLVLAGVVANFYFDEASLLYRMLGMISIGVLATPLALGTTGGEAFSQLLREARVELRKVVWPTRTEVTQTTLMVLAFVFIVALILWGLDAALGWTVSSWIG